MACGRPRSAEDSDRAPAHAFLSASMEWLVPPLRSCWTGIATGVDPISAGLRWECSTHKEIVKNLHKLWAWGIVNLTHPECLLEHAFLMTNYQGGVHRICATDELVTCDELVTFLPSFLTYLLTYLSNVQGRHSRP